VEGGGVEVRPTSIVRQREHIDRMSGRIDADDGVLPAVGDPRRTVGADDDAMRLRAVPERDLGHGSARGIEPPESAVALARVPDRTVRSGRDVMWMGARGNVELHELEGGC